MSAGSRLRGRGRLLLAALWACASVLLLGTSAHAESASSWTCTTDPAGVESCNVTAWYTPAPEPAPEPTPTVPPAPTEVVVMNGSAAPVPVSEVSPAPVQGASCGTYESPCAVEAGLDTMTAFGVLGLAGVLVGGIRVAQGLRR